MEIVMGIIGIYCCKIPMPSRYTYSTYMIVMMENGLAMNTLKG
jgi:hypothetical protein